MIKKKDRTEYIGYLRVITEDKKYDAIYANIVNANISLGDKRIELYYHRTNQNRLLEVSSKARVIELELFNGITITFNLCKLFSREDYGLSDKKHYLDVFEYSHIRME